ncbi:MAG TPA: response regulator [Terracidiphilus sp.]|nr:response regulator [Terracidiphilus sp.]
MESHSAILQPNPGKDGQVLLVDDEPALLKMMSVYLQRRGFAVTTSSSTDEASAMIDAQPLMYSVAVLDATMAGLSMEDLALKMLQANPSLRVLAASGYPVDMSRLEVAAPGRVGFLHKPFTPEMLADSVRRMIAAQKETEI